MRIWGVAGAILVVASVSVSGCSGDPSPPDRSGPLVRTAGDPSLPDRSAPLVKAEEARLATLLGADLSILGVPGVCAVRLLGQQAGASFMWAICREPEPPNSAASLPVRVDGTKVTVPADGSGYADSIRKMFPADLAEFALEQDSPDLRP